MTRKPPVRPVAPKSGQPRPLNIQSARPMVAELRMTMSAKFALGQLLATPGISEATGRRLAAVSRQTRGRRLGHRRRGGQAGQRSIAAGRHAASISLPMQERHEDLGDYGSRSIVDHDVAAKRLLSTTNAWALDRLGLIEVSSGRRTEAPPKGVSERTRAFIARCERGFQDRLPFGEHR